MIEEIEIEDAHLLQEEMADLEEMTEIEAETELETEMTEEIETKEGEVIDPEEEEILAQMILKEREEQAAAKATEREIEILEAPQEEMTAPERVTATLLKDRATTEKTVIKMMSDLFTNNFQTQNHT